MAGWPLQSTDMAARIRGFDWAATPLGPIDRWPQSLKTVVDLMLASPSMMSLVWGPDAIHLYNDGFTELLREHADEALGRSAYVTFARSRDVFEADVATGMAGRSKRLFAQRYPVLRNGRIEEAWFDVDYAPVRDEGGDIKGVLWTLREVTAQVQADHALRESDARSRLLIGSWAQAAAWETDPEGVVVADSPSWRAYTGQTLDEWLGYGWLDAVHPDDRAYAERQWRDAMAARSLVNAEFRLRMAEGGWRWTNVRAAPVLDEDGRIRKWAGMNIDIDARKQAEIALRDSERWLQTLMAGVPQLVWRAVDQGCWTWASPQWTAYTGQAEADSRGAGWLDPIHPDDREAVTLAWASASERGGLHADHRLFDAGEQRYRWFQSRAAPVRSSDGTIVEWLGTSTDIDDLRAMQDHQLVLVAELQHRVRNILTIVRSVFQRTVDADGPLDAMMEHFRGRLDNLARTQVIVTRSPEGQVDLRNLIVDELLGVGVSEGSQVILDGPDVAMDSRTAESISLAIHELTTNAAKYGALKTNSATLNVNWAIKTDCGGSRRLDLKWIEQGVPAMPVQPARHGFGRELIEDALPYRLGAETKLEFLGGGVRCAMCVPLSDEPASAEPWEGR